VSIVICTLYSCDSKSELILHDPSEIFVTCCFGAQKHVKQL